MKKLLTLTFLICVAQLFAQDYFEGKRLYCKCQNPEAIRLFNIGIETLYLNTSLNEKYLEKTAQVFFKAYKTDSTFCDAAFFTGYTLRLLNDKHALAYYYIADSLAENKSIEFKSNMAAEALRRNTPRGAEIALKKYSEIVQFFPESPEGYYGYAMLSPMINEYGKGLEYINIAIDKYNQAGKANEDAYYLKAILLALNTRYEEALEYFEKTRSTYKKEDHYKIYNALSLLKVSEAKNDPDMKKKAKKMYDKIEHKDLIPEDTAKLLVF
ncbi:MAG: hypothetical protein EOP00_28115 [Pedobacter sp.]|nr:MAG: hypothetical protein EOP00_28115 [Pedobacter sp.]